MPTFGGSCATRGSRRRHVDEFGLTQGGFAPASDALDRDDAKPPPQLAAQDDFPIPPDNGDDTCGSQTANSAFSQREARRVRIVIHHDAVAGRPSCAALAQAQRATPGTFLRRLTIGEAGRRDATRAASADVRQPGGNGLPPRRASESSAAAAGSGDWQRVVASVASN